MSTLTYSGKVRARDPETSWSAAALQTDTRAEQIKAVIVDLLMVHGPLTDEQLVDRYDAAVFMRDAPAATPQNVRTRRKALELDGRVRSTGRRARTRSGSTATVWAVAL